MEKFQMRNKENKFIVLLIILILSSSILVAQNREEERKREHQAVDRFLNEAMSKANDGPKIGENKGSQRLSKITDGFVEGEKSFLMNGNNIAVELFNYGGIAPGYPSANFRNVGNLIWRKLPYIFQFCPIVGASVPDNDDPNKRLYIISDGLYDYDNYREESPTGERWVWKPLPGYADPDQPYIASNPAFDADKDGKPDSWPREWYNPTLGEYVWPGYLAQGATNADLEIFWSMDDRDNKEFNYFPFVNDPDRKGIGVQVDGRAFQWSNSLAANALFVVYSITNVSDKDLDTVFFGIYGDPDLGYTGGGGNENKDDNGYFIPPYSIPGNNVEDIPVYARSMVYFWDPDMKGAGGLPMGYLGCKFLESPGNADDGIDNDGDGMIDERQDDGIDNDGDWDPETDDVGIDGIPNTGDEGEGDGVPTAGRRLPDGSPDPLYPGEPNFEYTDLDESDQIGLTSFNSWTWGEEKIYNDESIWYRNTPGNFGDIAQNADINFVFGSGYISLKKGETKRISMAFIFGETRSDLLTNAETVQEIYNKNYRFFKPPDLPTVSAVPGDKKVTLYWDSKAEESIDPITGKDFEGYVIYRSTDPNFSDILKVTDGKGASFLSTPLLTLTGSEARWDLQNEWKGYHPVSYQGRGLHYYLGDNSGLVHSYVDSNNVMNGQTYYYAVVAYDRGDSLSIPPSETTKKISVDPVTSQLRFDANTVQVTPGPRVSGYRSPSIGAQNIEHIGLGNGEVEFNILNDLEVGENTYVLTFSETMMVNDAVVNAKNYTVLSNNVITQEVKLFDTKFADLEKGNLSSDEFLTLKDKSGNNLALGEDYELNSVRGQIRRTKTDVPDEVVITYRYFPVYQSTLRDGEDYNPTFDGIQLKVKDYNQFDPDMEKSRWNTSRLKIPAAIRMTTLGTRRIKYPGDYDITFSDTKEYKALKRIGTTFVELPVDFKVEEVSTGIPKPIIVILQETALNDTAYTRGDEMILYKPGSTGAATDTLTWSIIFARATESDTIKPRGGDVYHFKTQRPYTVNDVFTVRTQPGIINNEDAKGSLDNIFVVPNPYIVTNEIEPANRLQGQNRGERRIYFENLPQKCTIRIFTLSGELVTSIEHESSMAHGREYWNLLNRDGFSVSYGIYIAHIDAPGVGEKLIKFALIK
jgi:hypothetical protein